MDRKVRSGHLCRGGDLSLASLGWFIGPLGNRADLMQRGRHCRPRCRETLFGSAPIEEMGYGIPHQLKSTLACLQTDPISPGSSSVNSCSRTLCKDRTLPAALVIRVISSSTARFFCLSVFTFPVSASTLIAPVLKSAPDSWYSR